MRYSELFGKTVRSVPSDIKSISHKLLYKGGFVRQISTGRYSFLPLGFRVWQKIFKIIEEEMEAIGSQRLITPTLHPIGFWKKTNRDQAFGEEMLTVADHHGATFAIGATAEGVMTELVNMFNPSYKDLPIIVHQFSEKFRDEKRPRGGLIRVREFTMKDAYSFDVSKRALLKSYQKFYNAYIKIAERLDLAVVPVLSHSGAIGGDYNHEFFVLSDAGEGVAFICDKCGFAVHEERASLVFELVNSKEKMKPFRTIEQPEWVKTMEDNQKYYKLPRDRFLKNVVYKTPEGQIIIAVLRGDLEVNEVKLKSVLKVDKLEPATVEDLKKIGTKPGYVHCWGHKGARYVGDFSLKTVKNFIGGQKEEATDSINVNYGRDFKVEILADIALAKEGFICSNCKEGKYKKIKGIEFGHVFKLDTFYSRPHSSFFTDKNGRKKLIWMGSYGIGLGRAMATIVEMHHDKDGIIWPVSVTPFDIHLVSLESKEKKVKKVAEKLYIFMEKASLEVLYDDRDESAGVKLKDADLIGIPVRIVVSKRTISNGGVEITRRKGKKSEVVSVDKLADKIREVYSGK